MATSPKKSKNERKRQMEWKRREVKREGKGEKYSCVQQYLIILYYRSGICKYKGCLDEGK